ncbi:zinc finger CCCH domain-containing protein 25 [Nymphaea colorata]|nr:zinc finger CCCH domain-containing protein 25 [Nymphaea colorata]
MNPLTLVKRTQKITAKEAELGISDEASWHAKYKNSAYIFVGGIPFDLTEGDLLAVFAQYGEVVDVNLVRDKGTGKSKGFAFIAYEDQRSTILAVDNLNGAKVLGRTIRVDHVADYKKREENEEEEQKKREERGVCRAYQRGDCTRGASCKFSHDEQRCANTGWGPREGESRWGHDKYDGPSSSRGGHTASSKGYLKESVDNARLRSRGHHKDEHSSRAGSNDPQGYRYSRRSEPNAEREMDTQGSRKRSRFEGLSSVSRYQAEEEDYNRRSRR